MTSAAQEAPPIPTEVTSRLRPARLSGSDEEEKLCGDDRSSALWWLGAGVEATKLQVVSLDTR